MYFFFFFFVRGFKNNLRTAPRRAALSFARAAGHFYRAAKICYTRQTEFSALEKRTDEKHECYVKPGKMYVREHIYGVVRRRCRSPAASKRRSWRRPILLGIRERRGHFAPRSGCIPDISLHFFPLPCVERKGTLRAARVLLARATRGNACAAYSFGGINQV